MTKHPGTLVQAKYRIAWLPRWTHDIGWRWLQSYQVVVIRSPTGRHVKRVYGLWLHWYTRSWSTPTACRGDGKKFIEVANA